MHILYPERIPVPFLFNPLKHHLGFIRDLVWETWIPGIHSNWPSIAREIKHTGVSMMDIYRGKIDAGSILEELRNQLQQPGLLDPGRFALYSGTNPEDFRTLLISDGSEWVVKYFPDPSRFIHVFPARSSNYTLRIKANTLKSAILYILFIGKDYISEEGLNSARSMMGLSPVRDVDEAESISRIIEMLRN